MGVSLRFPAVGWGAAVLAVAACLCAPVSAAPARKVVPGSQAEVELSFAPLVKRAGPAVVNIHAARSPTSLKDDPSFKQLPGEKAPPSQRGQNALGSGVILRADGTIVTNFHVVRGAEAITVILADRREFRAQVLRTDERTDLAVLKIEAGEALPRLELRNSDDIEVGDLVLAIGNPWGVGQTVTQGIVSAVARTSVGITDFRSFIQTDAAINPGNSGGALVGMDGRLIGINTAIFTRGGGSQGVGFAIPANMVAVVLQGAGSGQHLVRPWLGARVDSVSADLARRVGLARPTGAVVSFLSPGGPAERAGLRLGDVILSIDGRDVPDREALRYRVATRGLNETVALQVHRRSGEALAIQVTLVAPPEDPPRNARKIEGASPLSGATVANLSPALAEELGTPGIPEFGVIILSVEPGSTAEKVKLATGDVIAKVNGEDMSTVDRVVRATAEAREDWRLGIRRQNKMLDMTARRP